MLFPLFIALAGVALIHRLLSDAFAPGLKDIPGPWLARFTDLWKLLQARDGTAMTGMRAAQARYGDVVRIGPRDVLVSEPGAIEQVFGVKANWPKVSPRRGKGQRAPY